MSARIVIMLALVTVVSKVKADAVLRGVVLSNELGGPPMENVAVSADGANPNNTDATGRFTFTFPGKKPGETVRLIVSKQGYVVVNEIQLEVTLPADPQERPALLLLCKEGDREEMARRFYRLKLVAGADQTYKKEAQHADPAELGKLQEERDQAKKAADKRAEEFAKQKPGGGSELYRKAMRLFLDGKVDEALVTLSDEKLRELSKAAKEGNTEAEKTTEAIQAWLLKAQLFTVQFRFDDAEKAYQEAIDTSPESLKANFAFAHFNQQLNHYDKARRAYVRCLELARSKGNSGDIALTLNNLAIVDSDQNRPEAARNGYEEALKIRRELAQKNPETYRPDVAGTLLNLANLDSRQKRPETASKEYGEALEIYREFAQKNPDTYLPYVATALDQLANHDRHHKRPEAARNGYEEALKIRREFAQKNPDANLPAVAGTLNNLATLDQDQHRLKKAHKGYEEALKIFRELAQKNPDTYLPNVALTTANLATVYVLEDQLEAGRKGLEEALDIYEQLAAQNPDRFQPEVVRIKDLLQKLKLMQVLPF